MARSSTTFRVGDGRKRGNRKGAPNKVNKIQRERIEAFFEAHWDEFETEIWPKLEPKEKKDTFVALMNYRYPKLASVDVKSENKVEKSAVDALRDAVKDPDIV